MTGLPNRRAFEEYMERIRQPARSDAAMRC